MLFRSHKTVEAKGYKSVSDGPARVSERQCAFWKHNLNCRPLQRARNCGRDRSSMIAGDGPVKFHDRVLPESAPLAFIATLTISSKAPAAIAGF